MMQRLITTPSLSLDRAAQLLSVQVKNAQDISFSGIVAQDGDVEPGDLFLALPGQNVHGSQFIESARSRGAVAVLTDAVGATVDSSLPTLVVKDARAAGALLACALYADPTRTMQSIGITGTNGKTTVSTLLYQIFMAIGRESGLIGTVESRIGVDRIQSVRTTPEAPELQALAAVMVERHVRNLVMEVSSHALDLKRLIGSHFSIVGFTNLSQDHLDFHGDMESYFRAKKQLFTFEYADLGFVNIDNKYGEILARESEIPVVEISRLARSATWHFEEITSTATGYEFRLRGRDGILISSSTKMHGGFNLDNLLMAVAIAFESGVDPLELSRVIPGLTGAAGRLESIDVGQDFRAIVDYAHTPDAVINVLQAARDFTTGRVIGILGCGGDRDNSKRALMGSALLNHSDIAIFTSDNPRSENPTEILHQMSGHLSFEEPSQIIEDRKSAIAYAISVAGPGDTVMLLGKGHESGQEINGVVTAFDDRVELAQALKDLEMGARA
jgi:UDP-N-acetylmuramoyl-L-alanyl-D-glutamate--2,6-diaminopimelate ligase